MLRPDQRYEPFWNLLQSQSSEEKKTELLREWALQDLYFFAKFVIGYSWLTGPIHQEFASEIQKGENLHLFLLPRGHCKTQIFTIADSIRQYLLHPDQPIAIVCDALKRSTKKTRAVRWQFENNPRLRALYPEKIWQNPTKDAPKWTDDEFILPGHDGRQEPSFMATSLENQPTGLHFPIIKCDDIVTPETVSTVDQLKKNKESYGLMRSSILQTGGNIQIAGTIYDDADLHCDMERSGSYKVYKRPAIDPQTGQALWPEQFDIPVLNSIKRDPTVGLYTFSCQYLLDPAPQSADSYFQMDLFGRYDNYIREELTYYAAGDLAISEKDTACYTALVVVGINSKHQTHVVYVRRGHWAADKIIDNLLDIQKTWKPLCFAIECENIERTLAPFLRKKMAEENVFLNIELITPSQDKVARARSIQGRSREGYVLLPKRGLNEPSWLSDFELELMRFPKSATKDQVDSFALIGLLLDSQVSLYRAPTKTKTMAEIQIESIMRPKYIDPYEEQAYHEAEQSPFAEQAIYQDGEYGFQRGVGDW